MTSSLIVRTRKQAGFSLIEMAIVLTILSILLGGILVAVSQTTLNARRASALSELRQIEDALYGFAQSNGRLPCPATATSAGQEDPVGGGACTVIHGFVPAASLSMTGALNADGLLSDPWGNPYRYSVSSTATPNFTSSTAIKAFFNAGTAIASANMLKVCSESPCVTSLSNIVPALVYTMGENWANTTSANELANAGTGSLVGSQTYPVKVTADFDFVSTTYAEDLYDDQLVWLSPYVLFNKIVSAGKLP
jgi:prepilin-type N-terminal cleavage/methylation domain-containing protein